MPNDNGGTANRSESIKKLWSMMKDIKVAMLTTAMKDGTLRSRPMMTQNEEFDGNLWFFTGKESPKMHEIETNSEVNVSYADPDNNVFISFSGPAKYSNDRKVMQRLWSSAFETWFPQGLDDPNLALVQVRVEEAEYWDVPEGRMVGMFGFVRALATGDSLADIGENQKLKMKKGKLRPVRAASRSTRPARTKSMAKARRRTKSRK
jgi:general stress protein 26